LGTTSKDVKKKKITIKDVERSTPKGLAQMLPPGVEVVLKNR